MGKHVKMTHKTIFFLFFLKNTQKKFSGFLRFLEEHTKFFCAIRTYKPFLYVLIVNSPCTKKVHQEILKHEYMCRDISDV